VVWYLLRLNEADRERYGNPNAEGTRKRMRWYFVGRRGVYVERIVVEAWWGVKILL
jgi:hypothetical protein